ncbi:L-lactate dehydrogenase [Acerihabitans sp. TG2]|uniref:L-lactate dehydrogenase n=1 Tax=Acerihabitans sp. TG2 TaxID=3096008 RepID=UPI002B22D1C9|nr:L-lactate dehydrogenase [Acerihabitans sp. TG2]MEA9389528.1 L-lactate dehydrogenase [Acerihabitans sp. TG2]
MKPRKVMIIGAGNVGSSAAYALLNQKICQEIILVDLNSSLVEGHRKDLADAAAFMSGHIIISTRPATDCADVDIAVITVSAGAMKPGQNRLDELDGTARIVGNIVPEMMQNGFNGIFLVATNPCDIITYQVWQLSGLPRHQVLGTGVWLDTIRLRRILAEHLDIAPQSVDAFIIGEHGDTQFPVWSHSSVYGMTLNDYSRSKKGPELDLTALGEHTRRLGLEIYAQKGCTEYGVGETITEICRDLFTSSHRALTVSCVLDGEYGKQNLAIGVPAILTQRGVDQIIELNLNELELGQFDHSATVIKSNIARLPALPH